MKSAGNRLLAEDGVSKKNWLYAVDQYAGVHQIGAEDDLAAVPHLLVTRVQNQVRRAVERPGAPGLELLGDLQNARTVLLRGSWSVPAS